jgi:hypothetical protein
LGTLFRGAVSNAIFYSITDRMGGGKQNIGESRLVCRKFNKTGGAFSQNSIGS